MPEKQKVLSFDDGGTIVGQLTSPRASSYYNHFHTTTLVNYYAISEENTVVPEPIEFALFVKREELDKSGSCGIKVLMRMWLVLITHWYTTEMDKLTVKETKVAKAKTTKAKTTKAKNKTTDLAHSNSDRIDTLQVQSEMTLDLVKDIASTLKELAE